MPAGGGFDEAPALLCIPGHEATGAFFQSLLSALGLDRSVYAIDLPGHGQSDPLNSPPGVEESAAALGDLLDSLFLRSADVLADRAGIAVALALQQQRPTAIRRLVLSSASGPQRALVRSLRCPVLLTELQATGDGPLSAADAQRTEAGLRAFLGSAGAPVPPDA